MNFSELVQLPTVTIMVVAFGLIIGSFLNAVIYRLPRGISLLHPKRSFCPSCQHSLAWWENLPVLSWIFLKGRCSHCHAPISWRYPLIEIITAFLFLACYYHFGFPLTLPYWIFISLLIVATAIDFEYLIIPHEITFGGIAVGFVAATWFPSLMETISRGKALLLSAGSAAGAYLLLWGILELGKKFFGYQRLHFEFPQPFVIREEDEEKEWTHQEKQQIQEIKSLESNHGPLCSLAGEVIPFEALFPRPTDKVIVKAVSLEIAGERFTDCELQLHHHTITINNRSWSLEEALPLKAKFLDIKLPREAMGFGDVNFLACIGAFLGWKGILCSLFAGSLIGSVVGGLLLIITWGRLGRCIPFGPYLSLGALVWMFKGPELLEWYHIHAFIPHF